MRNLRLSYLNILLPGVLALNSAAFAAQTTATSTQDVIPVDWLLQQVRTGEATGKYDLATQALYRLQKIDPDNPEVIAAALRLAIHRGDQNKAAAYLAQLKQRAPDALATQEATASMMLVSADGRQRLQQARLLAASGRLPAARAAYDSLFNGVFPGVDNALEYWSLVSRIEGQQQTALSHLTTLDQRYPGNIGVQMQLARLYYQNNEETLAENKLKALAQNKLKALAQTPGASQQAATLWLSHIQSQPVTTQSVAQLDAYLLAFPDGDAHNSGAQLLVQQQKQLADPAFRARGRGLAQADNAQTAVAIAALRDALALNPQDAELAGAMGQVQGRAGNHAEAVTFLEQALKLGQQSTNTAKWQSLLQTHRYWLAIANGDSALAHGNISGAERNYQQARNLDSHNSYAPVGLGDVALARHNDVAAEQFFRQAWRMDNGNTTALRRLVALYQRHSSAQALEFINQLSPARQRALSDILNTLRGDALRSEADALAQQGDWAHAVEKYRRAQQMAADDVWLNYHLADALRRTGQPQQADAVIVAMAKRQPDDAAQVYASSLYFSASNRDDLALHQLNTLPRVRWDENMRELANRLEQDAVYARADRLQTQGNLSAAAATLATLPASPRRDITLADWSLEQGNACAALNGYQRILTKDAHNQDAALGRVEALLALNRQQQARTALTALPQAKDKPDLNTVRRIANAWHLAGDDARARQQYQRLKAPAAQASPSQTSALVFRDAARLESSTPDQAFQDYRLAMVASGMTPALPVSNDAFTRLTRSNAGDGWLQRSIRRDAADFYRRQDTTLNLAQDYSRNKGTGGIADFTAQTTMLQVDMPLAGAQSFFRADRVAVSAGSFSTTNGSHSDVFGTCADNGGAGCRRDIHQQAEGVALAAGWKTDRWSADLGTTPIGFDVINWVGGVSWDTVIQDTGLTLSASRRPISSSLLAYAGARDPSEQGGRRWGGVVATGGAVSLSYDRGGNHGVWANLSAHQISGKNVADNSRQRLMAGYYYKLLNQENQRVTVGLNSMLWHYQKDLSDYAFGQGGYYSPQQYVSLAVPVTWRQRFDNWSLDTGGSLSWSRSRTRAQQRYAVYPGFETSDNPVASGGSGSGFGYTLRSAIERRLSTHWSVGFSLDIQQAKDYTPSHALLYLRYSGAGWQGDMSMPPQSLTPYADFN